MFEEDDNEQKYDAFEYINEQEEGITEDEANRMLRLRRLERKQRKGNIWIARLHVLLRLIIVAGLIYSLNILMKLPQWYIDKDIFILPNSNLQILNNKIVPTYKIQNELKKISMNHEPVYKLETDKIRQNILELEPIDDVYIRRYWFPARLQIIVREKIPLLTLYADENSPAVAFFTQDGVLIGSEYLPLPATIQTLKVLAVGNYREWDKTKISTIQKIADYVEQLTSEKVEYVDVRNVADVYVKVNNLKLRIGGLDDAVYDRLSRLASIKPQLRKLDKPIQYVDLRWRNTVYIKNQ